MKWISRVVWVVVSMLSPGVWESARRDGRSGARRWVVVRRGLLAVAALGVWLGFGSASALAAEQFSYLSQLTGSATAAGQFQNAYSTAVDGFNGDVFVGDSGAHLVYVFSSTGTLVSTVNGSATPAGSFGTGQVTVAANDTSGDVYVADSTQHVVDVLNASGGYVCQITGKPGATTSSASECSGSTPGVPGGSLGVVQGVAVDQATGDVYVSDRTHRAVDVFDSSGSYLSQITGAATPQGSFSNVQSVAVDASAGDVFVADSGDELVQEFTTAGGYVATWNGANTPAGSFGQPLSVAVDNATGRVFVGESNHNVVDAFDSSGNYVGQITGTAPGTNAGALFPSVQGVSVAQATGDVYVADQADGVLDVFSGAPVLVPDVTTGAASGITASGATLNATVNPDGTTLTSCRFEYADAAHYDPAAPDPYSRGQTVPCASTPSGSSPSPVTAALTGLAPDTVYYFRVQAGNTGGTNAGSDQSLFVPGAPAGPAPSAGAGGLPDGRVYEQVSPENKSGWTAGVFIQGGGKPTTIQPTLASADGDALLSGGEDDQQALGANQNPLQYLTAFSRSPSGWSARGVLPPAPIPAVGSAGFDNNTIASADFSQLAIGSCPTCLWRTPQSEVDLIGSGGSIGLLSKPAIPDPVTTQVPAEMVGATADLGQIYFEYGGTLLPSDDAPNPAVGGASRSSVDSTFSNTPGLYEWTPAGGLSYAGVLPDGSVDPYGAMTVNPATSGGGEPMNFNGVSPDASRVFFLSPDPLSAHPASDPAELYVRETAADGSQRTVLVSGSAVTGRPAADSPVPVALDGLESTGVRLPPFVENSPLGLAVGLYAYPSPDGSRVFFEDVDALTADAPNDGTIKEYVFDTDTNTLTYLPGFEDQPPPTSTGLPYDARILAMAADGSSVLFAKGTPGGDSLDVWAAGKATPVAQFPEEQDCVYGGTSDTCSVMDAHASADGSVFVFETDSPIYTTAPGEFNNAGGHQEIYRYVTATGQLSCLSCGPAGLAHTGDANLTHNSLVGSAVFSADVSIFSDSRGISSDGDRVFFDSPDPLVAQATDGQSNVYEWEAAGDGSCPDGTSGGCLYLISTGQSAQGSFYLDNSANGNDVFFATTSGLVPGDTDNAYDIYDARVDGGFPAPVIVPCQGDSCQGAPGGAPALQTAGTVMFSGPGNVRQAAVSGRARVLTRVVRGDSFMLRVSVPGPGRITVTGATVRRVQGRVPRAGTFGVRVALSAKGRRMLARRRRLKPKLRVVYAPAGGSASAATVQLTVGR